MYMLKYIDNKINNNKDKLDLIRIQLYITKNVYFKILQEVKYSNKE